MVMTEANLLKSLEHPNVVALLKMFNRNGRYSVIYEFVERSLLDLLQRNSNGLSLETSMNYFWQAVNGVTFCHIRNCIHRDIKPENILIGADGIVKIRDFAFARKFSKNHAGFS